MSGGGRDQRASSPINRIHRARTALTVEGDHIAKFIYLYRGPAPATSATPLDAEERAKAFGAWMSKIGAGLIDVGSPFGTSISVRNDGMTGPAGDLIGYTIVEADDLAAAAVLIEGLPFLANRDGSCAYKSSSCYRCDSTATSCSTPGDPRRQWLSIAS